MGDIYRDEDYELQSHIDGLNLRFAPDGPIKELVRLQKEFDIFSPQHALEDSIALLNVTGASLSLREKWYSLVKWISKQKSDQPPKGGGEAIIDALRANLRSKNVLPVFFTAHDFNQDPRVKLNTKGMVAIFYISQPYLVISLPLKPRKQKRLAS